MREEDTIEDVLLDTVDLAAIDVGVLRVLNAQLAELDPVTEFAQYREVNETFHFVIFDASPQRMVCRQATQLWVLSEFYRSIYVRTDSAHRRVVDDHIRITDAITAGNREALVRLSDAHRDVTRTWLGHLLTRRS